MLRLFATTLPEHCHLVMLLGEEKLRGTGGLTVLKDGTLSEGECAGYE